VGRAKSGAPHSGAFCSGSAMTVGYSLVNNSKKEIIIFLHLPVNTMDEILSNDVAKLIISWYKERNAEDDIEFVSDTYDDWPFAIGKKSDIINYREITEEIVSILIKDGKIIDLGMDYIDEDEPDTVFIRKLSVK
jgi:hypothetical protein